MENDIKQIRNEIVFMEIRKKTYELRGSQESEDMCQSIIDHLQELIKYKEKKIE